VHYRFTKIRDVKEMNRVNVHNFSKSNLKSKTILFIMKTYNSLSHEAVLQNYDIIDVWLSVFSYAITLELLNLLLCLLA